jgi:thiamine kinase-like enzyme
MAAQIPPTARLSAPPPWALAHVPGLEQGQVPLRVERLAGGSVNEVFRIDTALGRFVVRLDGPAWRRPGVDRQRELSLQRAAAAAGITPSLIYADASREGLLISVYESGRLWSGTDYDDVRSLRRLGERLYVLHRLPAPALALFDPWQVAQEYVRVIQGAPAPPPAQSLRESLDRLQRECARLNETALSACIVHGDLTQANLLEGSRLWLLDWEYAQLSDPFMDLACVLAYYPGAQRHSGELAAAAGLDSARLSELLAPRLYVHRSLGWLWHLARGERPGPPP